MNPFPELNLGTLIDLPNPYGTPLDLGEGVTAYNFGTRCATIEDVNALLARGFKSGGIWDHAVRRYVEKDGVVDLNPDYINAPFGILILRHEDGRCWAVGVKLDKPSVN